MRSKDQGLESPRVQRRAVASPFPTAGKPLIPPQVFKPRLRPKRSDRSGRLGQQIRDLRQVSNLSAGSLARAAGVSRSMLSRFESGSVSPSIETLEKLAGSLNVQLSRLFSDQIETRSWCFVPAGKGVVVEFGNAAQGHQYELLGHVLCGRWRVQPYLVTLGAYAGPSAALEQQGVQFIHVFSGGMRYRHGSEIVHLRPGDSLLFEAKTEHGVEAVGNQPVSYLSISLRPRG
ncbi:XRE family transcriptional regulator [Variovorax sp. WS11]|nr:helix-turn-helix domain-containing protein [Variovorax sp. WS11]PSL81294.1 XRE family transcriptional regulator [Variovorax sp. WS11]